VQTDNCQVEHIGYVVSGSLHVEHEDGTSGEVTGATSIASRRATTPGP